MVGMDITAVTLPVRDLAACLDFYRDALELRVEETEDGAAVHVGSTVLRLHPAPDTVGDHHLAATVPADRFDAAVQWVVERAAVITLDGRDVFEGPPSWNSESVYFEGPDSSVLELIARRDLPTPQAVVDPPFSPDEILGLSEVGVAVPSVLDAISTLQEDAGLAVYGEPPSDTFGAVGTLAGMIILVRAGRTWFPTAEQKAEQSPIVMEAYGEIAGHYRLGATDLKISRYP